MHNRLGPNRGRRESLEVPGGVEHGAASVDICSARSYRAKGIPERGYRSGPDVRGKRTVFKVEACGHGMHERAELFVSSRRALSPFAGATRIRRLEVERHAFSTGL